MNPITRRQALTAASLWLGGGAAMHGQQQPQLAGEPAGRIPPVGELINALEMEGMARRKLDSATFAGIADGGDRAAFDRLTFRPRLMINTLQLDLSIDLFGQRMIAPILAGPAFLQQRFHPDAELATARGAAAAKTAMIVSERCTQPLERIAAEASGVPLWYQVFPDGDAGALRGRMDQAAQGGCKAICLTLGADPQGPAIDWSAMDRLRKGLALPFLLKGIMSPAEARTAVEHGIQGIIVSSYRGPQAREGLASPIEMLPSIAEAVAGRVPILIDGGFRRGSDILKALALGARAVVVTRPLLWGLAAYGAPGVQHILELLQSELGRDMAMCGRPNLGVIDKTVVRLHRR